MPNNLLAIPFPDLARLCAEFSYSEFRTFAEYTEYARAESFISESESISDRAELIDFLARDIRDMLHNANLDMLFHANDIDALSDFDRDDFDSHSALADRILNNLNEFAAIIADFMIL